MKKRLFVSMVLAASFVFAQTFEVAAIHPAAGGAPLIRATAGGTLSATNTSLQTLIRVAYRVGVPQISGPAWMAGTRFDITAKGSLEDVSLAVMAPKIRNLLAERFALKVHEESRMQTALVLTNGARIVPSEGGDAVLHLSRTAMAGKSISMDEFMRGLSDATGDLYVDQSGFTGRFDIDITWSRAPAEPIGADNEPPALSTVLREKFGLEVKAQKVSVVVLVVDRVDKNPTDN